MENIVLEANERKVIDKKNLNALRKQERVPGVLYSKRIDPLPIDVALKSINPLVFTTKAHIISLKVDGHDDHECVIKDIQFDPVTDKIVHFDLLGLTRGEKFQLEVPIKFTGNAIGVKEGGVLQEILHKINIECLPVNIPQSLEIDISNLKVGTSIHVKDLNFENIEILNPADAIIVTVSVPKVEKEAASVEEGAGTGASATVEPEVIGKGKESTDETN